MKLSLTFVLLLLLSVLVVFAGVGDAAATCDTVRCIQGGYITCKNYKEEKLEGCACVCAPKDGQGCVLHLDNGSKNDCPDPEKKNCTTTNY